jgi:hypothetical protein
MADAVGLIDEYGDGLGEEEPEGVGRAVLDAYPVKVG